MHDHPHRAHAHGEHSHHHGHAHPYHGDHSHGHVHHAHAAVAVLPATPAFSLVTLGAGARLGMALLLVGALWGVTHWALAP